MKQIAVLAILCFATLTAAAQAPANSDTLTIDARFPKSWGAGYSNFVIGASGEFWKQIEGKRIAIVGKFGVDRQPKDYIGSGITLRGSTGIRVGLPFGQSWAIRPFAGGRFTFSQQRNPQYTKTAYAGTIEAGVSALKDTLFLYGLAFLPDSTQNKTRGWGIAFDYYWRLNPRFSLHAGGTISRFKFWQPIGSSGRWYDGGGFTPTFGLTIHLKPERNYVPREFTKPIPNPPIAKPQPMIQRGQGYVGEFEKQFLKEKTNDQ